MSLRFSRYVRERIGPVIFFLISGVFAVWLALYLCGRRMTPAAFGAGLLPVLGYLLMLLFQFRRVRLLLYTLDAALQRTGPELNPGLCISLVKHSERMEAQYLGDFLSRLINTVRRENAAINRENTSRFTYIDQWTHDIKNPLAAIRLLCQNNPSQLTGSILSELDIADDYVEKTLTFSSALSKSRFQTLRMISLREVVHRAILRNKSRLILSKIHLDIQDMDVQVYSQQRWLEYIIHQILVNSINYRSSRDPIIRIYTERTPDGLALVIWDNGTGIKQEELGRIFDQGFVGTNDAYNSNASGIGLYICAQIAQRLDLTLRAASEYQHYTKMSLIFPESPDE